MTDIAICLQINLSVVLLDGHTFCGHSMAASTAVYSREALNSEEGFQQQEAAPCCSSAQMRKRSMQGHREA